MVSIADINRDGIPDLIGAPGQGATTNVVIYNGSNGTPLNTFLASDTENLQGVFLASGDLNDDGTPEIVTGVVSGTPRVTVYTALTGQVLTEFLAYDSSFRGGVRVAVGDVTGDGRPEIVTAPGEGGGSHIAIFDLDGRNLGLDFMAYSPNFRGGASVSIGDIDDDGVGEVIVGPGVGGGPHIMAFDARTRTAKLSFFAYSPEFRGGAWVASGDVDGNGLADIVTGAGFGGGPHVRVFAGTGTVVSEWMVYEESFTGGVRVGAADLDGDAFADVITAPGLGGGPRITIWDGFQFIRDQNFFAVTDGQPLGFGLKAPPPRTPLYDGVTFITPGTTGERAELVSDLLRRLTDLPGEIGVYRIDDREGRVGNLLPSDAGYTQAALAPSRRMRLFTPNAPISTSGVFQLQAATRYGFYIVRGGSYEQLEQEGFQDQFELGVVFPFTRRNTDEMQFRVGPRNRAAFEDVAALDSDFNDIIVDIRLAGEASDLPDSAPNIVNRPPIAMPDQLFTLFQTPVTIAVLNNDFDPDSDPLQLTGVTQPQHGSVTQNGPTVVYTPQANFSGSDSFTYTISDGRGGTASATVNITVAGIPSDFTDWTAAERGGTSTKRGRVEQSAQTAILREGDSFLTTLSKSFTIPSGATAIRLDYAELGFDTTDTGFINDAFEIALVDGTGNSLVPVFSANRDAFFNVTEGGQVSVGTGTTASKQSILVDVSQVAANTAATLVLRLINNDADTGSTVKLAGYLLPTVTAEAPVKFFVVDNGTDRTFRYGEEGLEAGTFSLGSKASPMGAASNPAGDRVWVVDGSSKQVTVYGPTGNTLGAWTASDAVNPQGVTVDNGTLWLVDRSTLDVRRYVGGALRTSGVANATDGFALNSANASPSDLVTDGSTIWVTDDVLAEVFVYTMFGDFLGRWKLDRDNAAPSGITKNPAGGSDLWVLDRGTKQVFQYPNGTNLRSGSATAAGTFQLARTNMTPEGIADPPVVTIDSPPSFAPAETTVLLTGTAMDEGGGAVLAVSVNGQPVEALDAAGGYFTRTILRPGENNYTVVAIGADESTKTVTVTTIATGMISGVDSTLFVDLSASFKAEYSRTSYKQSGQELYADVAVRNISQYPAGVPLYVAVKNISDPAVQVLNSAGVLPDGTPYYDFTGLVSGGGSQLAPDATTGTLSMSFANPNRGRFTYDLVFLGVPNRPPAFTSIPELEATIGREYVYPSTAADPDNDTLTFSLVSGPTGLTIDPQTGRVTWTPTSTQVGNFPVAIRVSDGRGGTAEQSYTIVSEVSRTNRPPVFTSLPIGNAQAGQVYRYDADATDPDRDILTYSLATGFPAGMTIDSTTGVIQWAPTHAQLRDTPLTVIAEDGRGGRAEQTYTICVKNDANRPPVIVSEPVRTVRGNVRVTGKVIVANDEWALSNAGFANQAATSQFARNIAMDFARGELGSFLVYSNNFGLNGATLADAFTRDGHSWTVSTNIPFTLDTLQQYDGVFVGGYEVDTSVLSTYVTNGGNVYLLAGTGITGQFGDAVTESAAWEPFLRPLGLSLADSYNQLTGNIPVLSDDPLFAGVGAFFMDIGQTILDTDPAGGGRIIVSSSGQGLFAVYDLTSGIAASSMYRYDVETLDPEGGPLTYSLTQKPDGMTIDETTGLISWVPGAGANLVTNLDFSDGNEGFVTDLTFSPNDGWPPSVYTIANRTYPWHGLATDFGDHTTGSGLMLLVNGSTVPDELIWGQSVEVQPNTTYEFSFWARSWTAGSPGQLQMWVNGHKVGAELLLPANTTEWVEYRGTWNSGSATTASISIRNATAAFGGNDFAIDDISFAVTGESLVGQSFPVNVRVEDGRGGSDEQRFTVTVTDQPALLPPPIPQPQAEYSTSANAPFRLPLPAIAATEFSLLSGPDGLMVHPSLGVVAWVPKRSEIGSYQVVVKATDVTGNMTLVPFTVNVIAPNTAPVITSLAFNGPATVGQTYEYRVFAQDAEQPANELRFSLRDALPGMAIDANTGVFTWTPTVAQVGSRVVNIVVSDGITASEQSFLLEVIATSTNRNPLVSVIAANASAWLGREYVTVVTGSDPDGDPVRFELVNGPTGMTIDSKTGVIRWPNPAITATALPIEVRSTDGRSGVATATFTLNVTASAQNREPQIVSVPPRIGLVGSPYRYNLTARDADGDTVLWQLASAPQGASLDPQRGTLRWTPAEDQTGLHTFTVRVLDTQFAFSEQTFTVDVSCENQPPNIVSRPPTVAYINDPYFYAVRAVDPEGDAFSFTLESGPSGMAFTPGTSLLRWTPTAAQDDPQNVTVRVTDSVGNVSRQTFTIVVSTESPNRSPVITSRPSLLATLGRVYSYAVVARDPDGDTLTYTLSEKPDGMTISATGVISWAPTTAGTFRITAEVTDGRGGVAVQTFTLTARANQAPTITAISDTNAAIGSTFRVQVRATDPESDPLTFALVQAPAGMTIDAQARIAWAVGGTPRSETVIVSATDAGGLSSTEEFIVLVIADTQAPNVRIQVTDRVTIGATVQITVLASDNVSVARVGLTANGTPVALDSQNRAFIPATQAGRITLVATATDLSGNTGSASADLRVIDPNAVSDVRANITRLDRLVAPGQIDSVVPDDNAPAPDVGFLTDVIGTVESIGQPLLEWKLLVARGDEVDLFNINVDSPVWRQIARGNTTVTNGKLGTFDPTSLPNDRYVLALAAYDVTGAGFVKPIEVNVIGNAKLGEFRLEFTDLSIPLNGIPIQISRIYDTRESTVSKDFGFGWTMGVRDARIRETVPAGESLVPDRTKVYLTAPDGSRVGFTYKERFSSGSFFGSVFTPYFVADKGHTYILTTPSDPQSFRGGIIGGLAGEGINPAHYRLTTPEGVSYDYDQFTGLQKIADQNNNIITFTANEIRHSGGKAITLDRDGQGRITTIRLPNGNFALRYRYDSKGDLVSIQQITETTPTEKALTSTVTYRADRPHYLDEYFDANGKRAAKTEYDPVTGRLVAVIDANGNRSEQISDPANFAETVKDARGNPTFITYNSRGNVTKTVQPTEFGDIVTQFFYDDPTNPDLETKIVNGRGFATTKTFDPRGNLLTETTDDGTTTYKYNAANKLTFVEDPLGRRTIYDYSPAGNLVRVVNPLGDDSLFTYDSNGRVATFEDFAGNTTMFADYCFCGRPMTITNPDGSIRRLTYNAFGQVLQATDERGNITRNFYDNQGRLIEVRYGEQVANNTTGTRYQYTGNNQTKIIDPLGNVTEYRYDDGGRKTHIIDAEGGVVVFGYDANGNLTKVTDPVNNLTEFRFDKANRVMQEIDPLKASRFFEYDAAGNRTKATDRNGKVRTFDYDALNRQTSEFWLAKGSVIRVIESKYDDVGNLIYSGDPNAILAYTYDALNRVKTATTVYPNTSVPTFTLTYGYDANGNRNSVVDNTGVRVDSTYDDRNQLESRTWQGGGIDAAKVVFDYFDNGERKSLDRYADATGSNKIGSSAYDYWRNGLSKTITHANGASQVLANYDYQYDTAGRLTQESHHGNTYIYGYDKTSQLLTVNKDGSLFESFSFDANGNRRTSTGPNGNQTYAPAGPGNQLLNDGIHSYTYDREGNLKTKTVIATGEVTEYFWDHRNRLVTVEQRTAGSIILSEYVYDSQGRRIAQESNGKTLWTVYDRDHAWVDTNGSGAVEARYLFTDRIDEILARWQPGEGTAWHLSDKLGTIRDLLNAAGAIVNNISYSAFGTILVQTNAAGGDRFTFTGREWDAAIGDYYYRARYYDPTAGRFTAVDPIGFYSNDHNLYRFVGNAPSLATDPSGKASLFEVAITTTSVGFLAGVLASEACALVLIVSGRKNEITVKQFIKPPLAGAVIGAFLPLIVSGSVYTSVAGELAEASIIKAGIKALLGGLASCTIDIIFE